MLDWSTYWPVVQKMLLHLKNCEKMFHIYFCSHPHRTQYARRLRVMTRVKKFEQLDFGIRGYLEQRHHWSQLLLKRHRHYQPQQQSTRLLLSQIFCIIHHVVGQSNQCNAALFLTKFTNYYRLEQLKNPVFPAEKKIIPDHIRKVRTTTDKGGSQSC